MSNLGRPRTGLKPCKHCQSTERDSNGQCHCRNLAYREAHKAPAKKRVSRKAPAIGPKTGPMSVAKTTNLLGVNVPPAPAPTIAQDLAALEAEQTVAEDGYDQAPAKPQPERYVLSVDEFEETKYARKDAAIKNGNRSGKAWTVTYKGKVVATSEV